MSRKSIYYNNLFAL